MPITPIIIISCISITCSLIYYRKQRKQHRNKLLHLHTERERFTKEDFIHYFENKGYKTNSISIIYNEIIDFLDVEEFSLLPDDNLHELCNFQDFDDIDLVDSICSKLEIKCPDDAAIEYLNKKYNIFCFEYILELTTIGESLK